MPVELADLDLRAELRIERIHPGERDVLADGGAEGDAGGVGAAAEFVDQRGAFDYERLFLGSFRFIVYKSA